MTCNGVSMKACGCKAGTTCPPDNCCQIVLNSSGSPVTHGDCPSCSTSGTCAAVPVPAGGIPVLEYQAACN
ncbi:MAG: hypothetical protein IPJ77_15675 [Planctomycetes bacterium]|nr:hypothetical protein [Planctomycetota bacterium]